jgi:hypothetical protein
MAVQVQRESDTTKARFVVPTYIDKDGNSFLTSSDKPFPVIDVNHLRLHEGRAFYVYKTFTKSSPLPVNGNLDIALAWPAGYAPHCVFTYQSGGSSEFYIYEAPTTSGGTSMTIHRRNRVITTTSAAAAVHTPTVTSLGTEIFGEFIASGQGGTGGGGEGFTSEFVLKPLTTYLFRITNVNSQSHEAELFLDWYE